MSVLGAFRSLAAGRAASPEHLEEIWRLVTEAGEQPVMCKNAGEEEIWRLVTEAGASDV